MLDLHTHSTSSDGSMAPADLVLLADKIKLKAIALTDHDSIDGIKEALRTAEHLSVELVPGVELSAELDNSSMHIVGLYVNPHEETFKEVLRKVRDMRKERNHNLVTRLSELRVPVSLDEAEAEAGNNVVGRPHFAALMVTKRYVRSINEAFKKYLGNNGSAIVPKERLTPSEAIRAIRSAGGVPVLAHPNQLNKNEEDLKQLLTYLTKIGLEGIETFYPSFTTTQAHQYSKLARHFNLVRSGGSDFHGAAKPKIKLGRGFGSLYIPDDLLEHIKQRSKEI